MYLRFKLIFWVEATYKVQNFKISRFQVPPFEKGGLGGIKTR